MLSSLPRSRPPTTEAEEIRARLPHVMRAQRCGGPEDGLPEVTPFLLTGFYLDKTDLSPRHPEHAAPAEVVRYLNVPVYPKRYAAEERCPQRGLYFGVVVGYVEMAHVLLGAGPD